MTVEDQIRAINAAARHLGDASPCFAPLLAAAGTLLAANAFASAHVAWLAAPDRCPNEGELWGNVQRSRIDLVHACGLKIPEASNA